MIIAGVDEAGRGPVLGPLVMAIASIKKEDEFKLHAIGVKDSKLLSKKKREELFPIVKELCKVDYVIVTPGEVDDALNSKTDNLNWIEARTTAALVKTAKPDKAILDCPSRNLKSYSDYIKKRLGRKKTEIIVEHKADLNYLIVGAASIIAKVIRDREMEKMRKAIKKEVGSGYASDPITQKFVAKYWNKTEFSKYFRKSWETWQNKKKEAAQKRLGEF